MTSAPLVHGTGPNRIIISHGWIASSEMWGPFLEHVDPDRYTVALWDHAGYGSRAADAGSRSLSRTADEIHAWARAQGWATATVLGHSMGGITAQILAHQHPEFLEAIILVASVRLAGASLDPAQYEQKETIAKDLDARLANITYNAGHASTAEWLEEVSWRTANADAMMSYLPDWAGTREAPSAPSHVPALLVVGLNDPATSPVVVRRDIAPLFTSVKMLEIPTGHYPMLQSPAALWASCVEFLEQHTRP